MLTRSQALELKMSSVSGGVLMRVVATLGMVINPVSLRAAVVWTKALSRNLEILQRQRHLQCCLPLTPITCTTICSCCKATLEDHDHIL